jgi:flagellum-specific peptidoglycan hydrolase FlgJ
VQAARKTRWQQATALVSLSTCGAMTGLAFAHGTVADLTSPTSMPVKLMALTKPAASGAAADTALRAAIVRAAQYYLHLAQSQSPSAMEALIWQNDSLDGVDHGESCAAFASLTLESGARATGQQSWVTGGTTYPWPVHAWVDSRVDPNPGSPDVTSVLQDAQTHDRWQPLGDGYTPQPGDWVLFDGHVEVVTKYAGGVLYTIGGDSGPNLSVNAHEYAGPLAAQGVAGFVNNGTLLSAVSQTSGGGARSSPTQVSGTRGSATWGSATRGSATQSDSAQAAPYLAPGAPDLAPGAPDQGQADIPGTAMSTLAVGSAVQAGAQPQSEGQAPSGGQAQQAESILSAGAGAALTDSAAIPGAAPVTGSVTSYAPVTSGPRYSRSQPVVSTPTAAGSAAEQAFINEIAPGALAAQRQYGIPAAVTIAQAIDESGWGRSQLAAQDNNLFGIKGAGPAGSVLRPTQEYENGQFVTVNAQFRVYRNVAQSITDHGLLLATGSSYRQAMADRRSPDAFANALTGVYATDPNYGTNLITIMRQHNLYRFDAGTSVHGTVPASGRVAPSGRTAPSGTAAPGRQQRSGSAPDGTALGGAQAAAQPGAIGPTAAIPGAVPVNAAALGLAGTPPPAHGAAGHRVSGDAGPTHSGTGHGTRVRHGAASGAGARPSSTGPSSAAPSSVRPSSARRSSGAPSSVRPSNAAPSSVRPSNATPSSAGPSSARPSSTGPSNAAPSSAGPSSARPSSARPSNATPSSAGPSSAGPSGVRPNSAAPSSVRPSSAGPSSAGPSGVRPSGVRPSGSGAVGTGLGSARIPGYETPVATPASWPAPAATSAYVQPTGGQVLRAGPSNVRISTRRYAPQMPRIVLTDFVTTAKVPLLRAKPIYQDVAANSGMNWQLLAAVDWMQSRAHPGVSPVYGEPLGAKNPDGTRYRTKSDALEQCAADLIELAAAVYGIVLTERLLLSVRDLANVFASFRWGSLLKTHRISAMEFPYSVEGLTAQHMKMRWPDIDEEAPDRPGTRFRMPFGAVPVVLGLGYPAIA